MSVNLEKDLKIRETFCILPSVEYSRSNLLSGMNSTVNYFADISVEGKSLFTWDSFVPPAQFGPRVPVPPPEICRRELLFQAL